MKCLCTKAVLTTQFTINPCKNIHTYGMRISHNVDIQESLNLYME